MNDTKIQRWASVCVIVAFVILLLYFALDYLLFATLPFFIAWLTAFALRPVSQKLSARLKIRARLIRLILSVLASVGFVALIVLILWYIVNKSWQFLSGIDQNEGFMSIISSILDGGFFSKLIFGEELLEYLIGAIRVIFSRLVESIAGLVSSFAMKLPGILVFMLVTAISAAYFAYDLEGINAAVCAVLPKSWTAFLKKLRRSFFGVGVRYLRSYLIIMSITFATLLIGFLILGVEYAVLIALLVAVLDILPVFGVGTVLVPWSIVSFLADKNGVGIGLLCLFLFITVMREIVEPKILGKNLGLHPLLTLILLYFGYYFFGFFGMIVLPPLGALAAALIEGDEKEKRAVYTSSDTKNLP